MCYSKHVIVDEELPSPSRPENYDNGNIVESCKISSGIEMPSFFNKVPSNATFTELPKLFEEKPFNPFKEDKSLDEKPFEAKEQAKAQILDSGNVVGQLLKLAQKFPK